MNSRDTSTALDTLKPLRLQDGLNTIVRMQHTAIAPLLTDDVMSVRLPTSKYRALLVIIVNNHLMKISQRVCDRSGRYILHLRASSSA